MVWLKFFCNLYVKVNLTTQVADTLKEEHNIDLCMVFCLKRCLPSMFKEYFSMIQTGISTV